MGLDCNLSIYHLFIGNIPEMCPYNFSEEEMFLSMSFRTLQKTTFLMLPVLDILMHSRILISLEKVYYHLHFVSLWLGYYYCVDAL